MHMRSVGNASARCLRIQWGRRVRESQVELAREAHAEIMHERLMAEPVRKRAVESQVPPARRLRGRDGQSKGGRSGARRGRRQVTEGAAAASGSRRRRHRRGGGAPLRKFGPPPARERRRAVAQRVRAVRNRLPVARNSRRIATRKRGCVRRATSASISHPAAAASGAPAAAAAAAATIYGRHCARASRSRDHLGAGHRARGDGEQRGAPRALLRDRFEFEHGQSPAIRGKHFELKAAVGRVDPCARRQLHLGLGRARALA